METPAENHTALRDNAGSGHAVRRGRNLGGSAQWRAMRVILRGTIFEAQLIFDQPPNNRERALLAATVLAWRRAGTGRNRGRGRLRARIQGDEWMRAQFDFFEQEVGR